MKPLNQWFGLGPYDEYEGYKIHWYNRCYEYNGTRIRFMAGDLFTYQETDSGGTIGPRFELSLGLAQEDIPEFYLPDNPNAKYNIHYLDLHFWRWGIYLSIRGKVYA